jgi:hypothetical protein
MRFHHYFFFLFFLLNLSPAFAQEEHESSTSHQQGHEDAKHEASQHEGSQHEGSEHEFKRHAVGLTIGHTHIQSGFKDDDSKWLVLPSFGLHYAYAITEKWLVALHSEIIVEDFVVKASGSGGENGHGGEVKETAVIERGRPVAVAVVGMYRIHKHITLLAGGGMEFSEHEDFGLVKIGADFPYHFGNNWELFGTLSWDFKIDAYDSFSFGFGVAKLF